MDYPCPFLTDLFYESYSNNIDFALKKINKKNTPCLHACVLIIKHYSFLQILSKSPLKQISIKPEWYLIIAGAVFYCCFAMLLILDDTDDSNVHQSALERKKHINLTVLIQVTLPNIGYVSNLGPHIKEPQD